jgi:hypothetical protein
VGGKSKRQVDREQRGSIYTMESIGVVDDRVEKDAWLLTFGYSWLDKIKSQ